MPEDTLDTIVRIVALSCGDVNIPPRAEYIPQLLLKCSRLGEKAWGIILLLLQTVASGFTDNNIILFPPPLVGRIEKMCVLDWKTLELEGYNLTSYIGYRAEYETGTVMMKGKEYYVYIPIAVAVGIQYKDVNGGSLVNGYILAKTNESADTTLSDMGTKPLTLAYINPNTPLMKAIMKKCDLMGTIVDAEEYLIHAIEEGKTYLFSETKQEEENKEEEKTTTEFEEEEEEDEDEETEEFFLP